MMKTAVLILFLCIKAINTGDPEKDVHTAHSKSGFTANSEQSLTIKCGKEVKFVCSESGILNPPMNITHPKPDQSLDVRIVKDVAKVIGQNVKVEDMLKTVEATLVVGRNDSGQYVCNIGLPNGALLRHFVYVKVDMSTPCSSGPSFGMITSCILALLYTASSLML